MADAILHIVAQLCKGLVVTFWYKYRVVAETAITTLICYQMTFYRSVEEMLLTIHYKGNGCAETSLWQVIAIKRSYGVKATEQAVHVAFVLSLTKSVRIYSELSSILGRKACREHTWEIAEALHLKT